MNKHTCLFFVIFALSLTISKANNISVTNAFLGAQNTVLDFNLVRFDLAWENSWRITAAPSNWDAAWVFVKYRVSAASGGDGLWKQAKLNLTGHIAPPGSIITPAADGTGIFVYRNADGAGTNTWPGVELRWNYGLNFKTGTTPIGDYDIVDIQIFAIEMVYVPSGSFTVGSGGTEVASFTNGPWTSGPTFALSIASEGALTVANSTGNLWYTAVAAGQYGDRLGPIPAAFPKGYLAFYCMKYEVSQQGYVNFLNSLTTTQAANRFPGQTTNRHGITFSGTVYSTSLPAVACNFLNWADLAAYLDWSGLRPMTELEFEKACRGSGPAIANEYAWGNTSVTAATGINNPGTDTELPSNPAANASFFNSGTGGPLRVGVFATPSSARSTSGASYYGSMEMSGNVFERPVTLGNPTGRSFTGIHGDGALDASGNANTMLWPGIDAIGASFRGGDWDWGSAPMRVSERLFGAFPLNARGSGYGGRGIRLAP